MSDTPKRRSVEDAPLPTAPLQWSDAPALDLVALKAAAQAATPGPWSYEAEDNMVSYEGCKLIAWQPRSNNVGLPQRCANGEFIAAANPAAILALLDRLAELERLNTELHGLVHAAHGIALTVSNDEVFIDGFGVLPLGTVARIADLEKALRESGGATKAWSGELPELPHTNYNGYADGSEPLYTADQMRDYTRSSVGAALEEVENIVLQQCMGMAAKDLRLTRILDAIRALNKLAPAGADDLDIRKRVAVALGLPINGLRDGKPVSFAWSYLLGAIKDCATEGVPAGATGPIHGLPFADLASAINAYEQIGMPPQSAQELPPPDAWMKAGTQECTSATHKQWMENAGYGVWKDVGAQYTRPLYFGPILAPQSAPTEPNSAPQSAVAVPQDAMAKGHAVQQAQTWAMEARTQRSIVLDILRYFGLPEQDYSALSLIKAKFDAVPGVLEAAAPTDAKAEQQAKNAARYEWLRTRSYVEVRVNPVEFGAPEPGCEGRPARLDAAVDRAIADEADHGRTAR